MAALLATFTWAVKSDMNVTPDASVSALDRDQTANFHGQPAPALKIWAPVCSGPSCRSWWSISSGQALRLPCELTPDQFFGGDATNACNSILAIASESWALSHANKH